MKKFKGFPPGKMRMIELPAQFFSDLLPMIDSAAELKVTLFCFWALHQKTGDYRYLSLSDFTSDETLMRGLAVLDSSRSAESLLGEALAMAVKRGTLLCAEVMLYSEKQPLYFMNTVRGQAALRQLQKADGWVEKDGINRIEILPERPTIYRLYEENIGILTPLIADEMRDAEKEYPAAWIEKAIKQAAEMNKRSWRYIIKTLERWHKNGSTSSPRPVGENNAKRNITGTYSDFSE